MAKGNGERPAKKGAIDSTLLELQETLSRPKSPETGPAQVVTAPEVVQAGPIAEPVLPQEPVSTPEISPTNPTTPVAEAGEPKAIPPELKAIYGDTVPAGKIEMFEKLKGTKKREDYLAKLAVDEKEKKERQSKKPTKPRVRKPKPTPVENLKAQMQKEAAEEVRQMTAARASALKPSGADPDTPTIKIEVPAVVISPEAQKAETEEQAEIDKRIAAARAPDVATQTKIEYRSLADRGVPDAEDNWKEFQDIQEENNRAIASGDMSAKAAAEARMDAFMAKQHAIVGKMEEYAESMPAVFRNNRERIKSEAKIIPDPEDAADQEHMQEILGSKEGTPKEWREKLRELIEKAGVKTKEKVVWWKSAEEGLIRRRDELDAQAEKISGTERWFRTLGEKYNKLPFKYKVALGATLGVGAVVTAGSLAMTLPLLGIAGQRAAGLATMYLKFEKNSHQEKWGKEKAMLKAGAYTVLLGLTMKEAIEYASQTEIAHAAQAKVEGWLGTMLGHESVPPSESAKLTPAPKNIPDASRTAAVAETAPASPPEVPAAAAAAGEVAAPAPEMPDISVEATKGRGYEYMMKRLWEQLQDKGLDASKFGVDSDIYKLLMADEKSIDSVVHRIAMDPKHGFFHPDGTSVRIDLGSHLAINADGQLELNGAVQAPAGAPVTPVYHPGAPSALTTETVVSPPPVAPGPDLTAAQDEAAKHISPPPLQEAPAPATPGTPSAGEQPLAWRTGSGGELVDRSGNPIHAGVSESLPGANNFGIVVPEAIPHIYADSSADRLFAYGGSSKERATLISEYLMRHPDKVVFAADDSGKRVPWHFVEGKAVAGPPMRASGFMSIFSSWMKAPSPNDLAKVIK